MTRQAAAAPLRLTRRGRVLRDLAAGGSILTVALFAQPISVGYFTAVVWLGHVTGWAA